MKDVIYLDILLLTNFLTAYFFLLAAGRLSGQCARFARLAAAAGLAALSALILFAPELPYPVQLGYRAATAALIVRAAYAWAGWRRFAAAAVWFMLFNVLLAGFAMLYVLRTGSPLVHTANLAVYVRVSPLLLVTASAGCCLGVGAVQRLLAPPRAAPETAGLSFALCGTPLHLRAVLDTGCRLRDPLSCLPVLLVSYPDACARLPAEVGRYLAGWFDGRHAAQPPPGARLRMIPCTTAAGRTLLPGFAVEEIGLITTRGVVALGPAAVAFSPQPLGGNAYEALYGPDLLLPKEGIPWR